MLGRIRSLLSLLSLHSISTNTTILCFSQVYHIVSVIPCLTSSAMCNTSHRGACVSSHSMVSDGLAIKQYPHSSDYFQIIFIPSTSASSTNSFVPPLAATLWIDELLFFQGPQWPHPNVRSEIKIIWCSRGRAWLSAAGEQRWGSKLGSRTRRPRGCSHVIPQDKTFTIPREC